MRSTLAILLAASLFHACATPPEPPPQSWAERAAAASGDEPATSGEEPAASGDEPAQPREAAYATEEAPNDALASASALESAEPEQAEPTEGEPREPLAEAEHAGASASEGAGFGAALDVWRSPSFERWFAESFLSETEIEPRVPAEDVERIQDVMALLAAEKTDKALAMLEKERAGRSAVFDFTLGGLRFGREELPAAAEAFRAAAEKHPKFRRAWRSLGMTHLRMGEARLAVEALTRAIELGANDALTYGLLGITYLELGEPVGAESALRMAVLLDPHSFDFKLGLARSFFDQKRFPDAVALCETLIAAQPQRAELWLLQANALIALGQPTRAAQNLEVVDGLDKSKPETLNLLGDVYVNEGLFDLAVGAYLRALEKDPAATAARALTSAQALGARGAREEALLLLTRVEELAGDRLDTTQRKAGLKLRARLAMAAGAGEEEARILEEIVALDPLDGEALLLLGQHAGRGGDVEKAIFYFERAASLEAFEADAKVRHAQLLVNQQRLLEALPLLRSAQSLQPRDNVQEFLEQVERLAQSNR